MRQGLGELLKLDGGGVKLTNGRGIGHNCNSPRRETSIKWLRGREGVVLLSPAAQLRGVEVEVVVSSGVRLADRRQRSGG